MLFIESLSLKGMQNSTWVFWISYWREFDKLERPNSNPMSGSFFMITRHLITLQWWRSFWRTGTCYSPPPTLLARSCTCRLLSLPQVKIFRKRAAFWNSVQWQGSLTTFQKLLSWRAWRSWRNVQTNALIKEECILNNKNKSCPYKKLSVFHKSCLKSFGSHLVNT